MSTQQTYTPNPSVKAQFDLSGRICMITGGAGFLGRQFAAGLAEMSGHPVLIDVDPATLTQACAEVSREWGRCDYDIADVTDFSSLEAVVARTIERFERVDVLINNAALTKYGCDADPEAFFAPFERTVDTVWEAGLSVNLTGVVNACRAVSGVMLKQGHGVIINIGSDVGVISPDHRIYEPDEHGYEGVDFNIPAFYAVSKAGVIHLTRYLATRWARKGIRVNAFSPAGVYRNHEDGFAKKLSACIPMGRMGAINEYKAAIVFLASDASSFMTGHNLIMDGGRTVW